MGMFSDASNLKLKIDKSTLIDVSASLIWPGKRVDKGSVFRYLGYPLGVDVTNKQLWTGCWTKFAIKFTIGTQVTGHFMLGLESLRPSLFPMFFISYLC